MKPSTFNRLMHSTLRLLIYAEQTNNHTFLTPDAPILTTKPPNPFRGPPEQLVKLTK